MVIRRSWSCYHFNLFNTFNCPAFVHIWDIRLSKFKFLLTHWGRVTHICVSKVTIIVSDNGLSPGRRQAIIWNNARILLIGPLGTNFSGILIKIHAFSFKKMLLKMSSGKWRPFCSGLNVLMFFRVAFCFLLSLTQWHQRTHSDSF